MGFAHKLQQEEPSDILNALSFKDKHKLYALLQADLSKDASSELHQQCTMHVNAPPPLVQTAIPTILKYDEQSTWPQPKQFANPNPMTMDANMDTIDADVDMNMMEQEDVHMDIGNENEQQMEQI